VESKSSREGCDRRSGRRSAAPPSTGNTDYFRAPRSGWTCPLEPRNFYPRLASLHHAYGHERWKNSRPQPPGPGPFFCVGTFGPGRNRHGACGAISSPQSPPTPQVRQPGQVVYRPGCLATRRSTDWSESTPESDTKLSWPRSSATSRGGAVSPAEYGKRHDPSFRRQSLRPIRPSRPDRFEFCDASSHQPAAIVRSCAARDRRPVPIEVRPHISTPLAGKPVWLTTKFLTCSGTDTLSISQRA
jgi:hypothetical protein